METQYYHAKKGTEYCGDSTLEIIDYSDGPSLHKPGKRFVDSTTGGVVLMNLTEKARARVIEIFDALPKGATMTDVQNTFLQEEWIEYDKELPPTIN